MPTFSGLRIYHRFRTSVQLILLLVLVGVAVFVRTAPARNENRLKNATLDELQNITKNTPLNDRASYYLGVRLQQNRQIEAAYDAFSHAADLDPTDEKSWLAAAGAATILHGDQGGFDILATFLKANPENARARLAMALLYQKNGSYERAMQEAQKSIQADPKAADAWRVLGVSQKELAHLADAETSLKQAVTLGTNDWRNYTARAEVLLLLNRLPDALAAIRESVRIAPLEADTHLALGQRLLASAVTAADAETALQSLLKSDSLRPNDALILVWVARAQVKQEKWSEARDTLERAKKLAPNDPDAAFELGRVYHKLGNEAASIREIKRHSARRAYLTTTRNLHLRIVTGGENSPDARLRLARLYRDNGDTREALQQYRQLAARSPDLIIVKQEQSELENRIKAEESAPNSETLVEQGNFYFAQRKFEKASSAYLSVLKQEPDSAPALQGAGLVMAAAGDKESAFKLLIRALRTDPSLTESRKTIARIYLESEFQDRAYTQLKRVVKESPYDAEAWNLLGMASKDNESLKSEAEEAMRRAVILSPNNSVYIGDLGEILVDHNKIAETEKLYRSALVNNPADITLLSRLGMFLVEHHSTAAGTREAETLLQRVIATDPNDPGACFGLGRIALSKNDARSAIRYLNAFFTRTKQTSSSDVWFWLGRAYQKAGDMEQAAKAQNTSRKLRESYQELKHLEAAASMNPTNGEAHRNLARAYLQAGNNARAIAYFRKALLLNPADKAAKKELAILETNLKISGKLPQLSLFTAMVNAKP